ncbi:MAG: beta-propeller fold lactonase family protein [Nitrospinota bacterium]
MISHRMFVGLVVVFVMTLISPLSVAARDLPEEVFEESCSLCHDLDRVTERRLSRAEWEEVIDRMVEFGADISGNKRKMILEYLVRVQGQPAAPAARAYVVNEKSEEVWVIDVASRKVRAKIKVGKLPHGIVASPDGNTLYVTNMGSNDITVINGETHEKTSMGGAGRNPHECAVGPTGRFLYVSNPSSNTVTVHDMTSHTPVATIPVGKFPHGVTISPDGARVYAANILRRIRLLRSSRRLRGLTRWP